MKGSDSFAAMKKCYFLFLLAVLVACTHKPFIPHTVTTVTTTTTRDTTDSLVYVPDTSVCFERDVLPIFISSCAKAGCHDAITKKDGYNFSSYATIIAKGLVRYNSAGSKVYTKCLSGKMPESPTPKLDSTQLSFIRRWIDKGAPNDTDCPVVCDTTQYTYAGIITPIMRTYCYGCHATAVAPSSGGNFALDTYTGLSAQALNGNLLGCVAHDAGFQAMPQGGNELPAGQIIQIRKWIQAGAPNN
jgi:hypothetical protein